MALFKGLAASFLGDLGVLLPLLLEEFLSVLLVLFPELLERSLRTGRGERAGEEHALPFCALDLTMAADKLRHGSVSAD